MDVIWGSKLPASLLSVTFYCSHESKLSLKYSGNNGAVKVAQLFDELYQIFYNLQSQKHRFWNKQVYYGRTALEGNIQAENLYYVLSVIWWGQNDVTMVSGNHQPTEGCIQNHIENQRINVKV